MSNTPTKHSRATVFTFAAQAEIDPRTAQRILEEGVEAVRGAALQERAKRVLAELRIKTATSGRGRAA